METVTRLRGATRDADDRPVAGSTQELRATAIAPGSSAGNRDRGRNGAKVAFTAYFYPPVDLQDGDQLLVRGTLCDLVIQDWRSPYGTGRRGLEVLCSAGKG